MKSLNASIYPYTSSAAARNSGSKPGSELLDDRASHIEIGEDESASVDESLVVDESQVRPSAETSGAM